MTATLHQLALPELEPAEQIARGCGLAIGGIATVIFELEGQVMLLQDLDDDPPSRIVDDVGYYQRRIGDYERKISTLAEAQRVLEELAAEVGAHIAWARGTPP
jgi:hypothetical protein